MKSAMSTMAVSPELGIWRDWPTHEPSLSLTMWEELGPLHGGSTMVPKSHSSSLDRMVMTLDQS